MTEVISFGPSAAKNVSARADEWELRMSEDTCAHSVTNRNAFQDTKVKENHLEAFLRVMN